VNRDVRSRILLGVGIPVAAFVFLAVLILALSRVLLAVPPELAPWVALLFAATILMGCTLAATIRGTRGFAFLIGVLVLTIVGGGIAGAVVGEYPVHSLVEEEEAGPPGEEPAPSPPPGEESPPPGEGSPPPGESPAPPGPAPGATTVVAENLTFDVTELTLPAEGEVTIELDNRDPGQLHNISIYTEPGGEALFQGELITGPATTTYRFPAPEPGQDYFQCDVHPTTMSGTVTVG
jgi:Cupredoxin-like domain